VAKRNGNKESRKPKQDKKKEKKASSISELAAGLAGDEHQTEDG